ncbi:hypothetical protein EVAR_68521_1 [Eumeta japonica]|uniref:Cuticle protein 6 n=1 Tax=Eumeta variegata TaxID=151549 RepID=A0A4C1ZFX1_EUMVA|nr:hypothetical protein EVAR_68521_1 [Eumeta japonica]
MTKGTESRGRSRRAPAHRSTLQCSLVVRLRLQPRAIDMQPGRLVFLISLFQCSCLANLAANNHTSVDEQDDAEVQKHNVTKEILKASETADPAKVEIVKQIRRLNEDGSYTIGYEADDGTFKIESRDVLGNIKGTFGYIDKDGEIKRVTYSSSSDSTPHTTPTTTTTTSTTPMPTAVRVNNTASSTTRRPLPTVVYPRGSHTTRGTVIQPIPRRRPISGTNRSATTIDVTTTERPKTLNDATKSDTFDVYKSKNEESVKTIRTQILKPLPDSIREDLESKHLSDTMKTAQTLKPVFEDTNEDKIEKVVNKANTIRRELSATNSNPHMLHLQQSIGDDSTDVYGSHLSHGTVRPLFTTTTPRPRLIPFQSILAAKQKLQQQYQDVPMEPEHETTIEASTGRVFDRENVVTSNPVPVVQIPLQERDDQFFHQQIYRRPLAAVQFRSHEYMRDNPGAPIPIGNQRPFPNLGYQPQHKTFEPQFLQEASQSQAKVENQEPSTLEPYEIRPVTKIIPIPVDERGIPIQGYQPRFVNSYVTTTQPPVPVLFRSRVIETPQDDMSSIATPVSTRDLRRLLHILLIRQARLQTLMDQLVAPGPSYQSLPLFRQAITPFGGYNSRSVAADGYQNVVTPRHYPRADDRYDYQGYDQQYRSQQQELYTNQISNYEQPQYESQRYVPRRRNPRLPAYDAAGASTNQVEESSDYLPSEVREALLLKMLVLAISPDYMPTPAPSTELTTAAPPRKQVRNVQILGEEGSMDDMKRKMQRH